MESIARFRCKASIFINRVSIAANGKAPQQNLSEALLTFPSSRRGDGIQSERSNMLTFANQVRRVLGSSLPMKSDEAGSKSMGFSTNEARSGSKANRVKLNFDLMCSGGKMKGKETGHKLGLTSLCRFLVFILINFRNRLFCYTYSDSC